MISQVCSASNGKRFTLLTNTYVKFLAIINYHIWDLFDRFKNVKGFRANRRKGCGLGNSK